MCTKNNVKIHVKERPSDEFISLIIILLSRKIDKYIFISELIKYRKQARRFTKKQMAQYCNFLLLYQFFFFPMTFIRRRHTAATPTYYTHIYNDSCENRTDRRSGEEGPGQTGDAKEERRKGENLRRKQNQNRQPKMQNRTRYKAQYDTTRRITS